MKSSRVVLAILLVAVMLPMAAPAASGVAADDNVPGVPIPASPFGGTLHTSQDPDDVYAVYLKAGQSLTVALKGADTTGFDLLLYGPGATDVWGDTPAWGSVSAGSVELFRYDATASGMYYLDIYAAEGSGSYTVSWHIEDEEPGLLTFSFEGLGRIETAIAVSRSLYYEGSEYVIIATARNFPDALGGSALAGIIQAPILLTEPAALPASVGIEITENLGASRAIILGGEAAVSAAVERTLQGLLGEGNVVRISGDSRYETAQNVAMRVIQEREALPEPPAGHLAFVATGKKFADAVAASSFASWGAFPFFLVSQDDDPLEFAETLKTAGIDTVVILGGDAAVPDAIGIAIEDAGITVGDRLAGDSRYETAAMVAHEFSLATGMGPDGEVAITTGTKFPDALAGGAALGNYSVPILLTQPTALDPFALGYLTTWGPNIRYLGFLGGVVSVDVPTRAAVRRAIVGAWGVTSLSALSVPSADYYTSFAVTRERPAERIEEPIRRK